MCESVNCSICEGDEIKIKKILAIVQMARNLKKIRSIKIKKEILMKGFISFNNQYGIGI